MTPSLIRLLMVLPVLSPLSSDKQRYFCWQGGVWDLDYALSPNLTWFLDTATEAVEDTEAAMNASTAMGGFGGAHDLLGLRFDSLNSGLYVVDDVSGAVARGSFPLETLSVEAVLSIDSDVRIALGGIVAAGEVYAHHPRPCKRLNSSVS